MLNAVTGQSDLDLRLAVLSLDPVDGVECYYEPFFTGDGEAVNVLALSDASLSSSSGFNLVLRVRGLAVPIHGTPGLRAPNLFG